MTKPLLIGVGALLVVVGVLRTLQRLGYIVLGLLGCGRSAQWTHG